MVVLKVSQNLQKSTLVLESCFKKAVRRRLIKKRARHRCFHVSFAKFLRTFILRNFREWLLTDQVYENKLPVKRQRKDNS